MVDALGGYKVLARINAHESDRVVRASDPRTGQIVAIKRVAGASATEGSRLAAYSRMIGQLTHPNIVGVQEVLRTHDELYLVEEWVEGAALDELTSGPLDARAGVALLLGVLQGLSHAHDRGIVHGDVCPANILLSAAGTPRLIGFGLAGPLGATRSGQSPEFTSPEAGAGRVLIPASDVYSAAVVLLTVTARPTRNNVAEPVPGLSPGLGAVLAQALDPVPENRHADAGAFLRALDAAAVDAFGFGWQIKVDLGPLVRSSRSARAPRSRRLLGRSRAAVGGTGIAPVTEQRSAGG